MELTKVAKKNRDRYQYIKTRHSGGDTFPIGNGAGGNVSDLGIFNMSQEKSMYIKYNDEHIRYKRIASLFQFPKINKDEMFSFLNKAEQKTFLKKIELFKEYEYVKEDGDSYLLTRDGIFWGNSISRTTINALIRAKYDK